MVPEHQYLRADVVNEEIQREVTHFGYLKLLIAENLGGRSSERCGDSLRSAANRRRTNQWKEEAAQEQRTFAKRRRKKHRAGGGANEDVDEEVTDLISQVHTKLSVPLESRVTDLELATYT